VTRRRWIAAATGSLLPSVALALKPGYQECAYQRADVQWGDGLGLPADYSAIDYLMEDSERFHRFRFVHRLQVVACRSWADFHEFVPFIEGELVGGLTLEYGTTIYITPRVEEMHYHTSEFLRHELSHALLLQNSSIASRTQFKRVPWLYEGVAVLAGDQRAYGTAADFARRAASEALAPLFDPAAFERPGFDLRMAYRAWRYFLEDLIAERGRDRFQVLLARFMQRPLAIDSTFANVYGTPLPAAIAIFENKVRLGEWTQGKVEKLSNKK
jgi:hypothetical protein